MLSSNLQSLLENRLHYLPEISAQAISSIDWSTKLIEIGRHYGLHMDEMEDLQTVVLKLLIGLRSAKDFENDLISALALSPTNATNMMVDIDEQIFIPIHDFVINKGKKPDALTASGIVLQPVLETAPSAELSSASVPASSSGNSLEIPASPATVRENAAVPVSKMTQAVPMAPAFQKSTAGKPFVQGKFDDFFVNVPTSSNQSLGK